jgi:hypothetical protein
MQMSKRDQNGKEADNGSPRPTGWRAMEWAVVFALLAITAPIWIVIWTALANSLAIWA